MILRPWPMILRSLPITDFSPVDGVLIDDSAPSVLLGRAVRSGFGAADELRVNMKSPNTIRLALQASHRNMIPTHPATKTRHATAGGWARHEAVLGSLEFTGPRSPNRN